MRAIVVSLAIVGTAGCGSKDLPTGPTDVISSWAWVTGTWVGRADDDVAGPGAFVLELVWDAGRISGSWRMIFPESGRSGGGAVDFTVPYAEDQLALVLHETACVRNGLEMPMQMEFTPKGKRQATAIYRRIGVCPASGSVSFTKVN